MVPVPGPAPWRAPAYPRCVDPERDGDERQRRRLLRRRRTPRDNPARRYNNPPDAKLLDVPGLLIVAGLAVAGFLLALVLITYLL
jgi:hypothetical protein